MKQKTREKQSSHSTNKTLQNFWFHKKKLYKRDSSANLYLRKINRNICKLITTLIDDDVNDNDNNDDDIIIISIEANNNI
jgi:hypothetical protein